MPGAEMKELVQLKPMTVRWDQVYLDPQNPRLAEIELGEERTPLPDAQVVDSRVQADLLDRLRNDIGIDDLVQKMSKLGFLTIDRIVVRPLVGVEDSYVVLEGNRRVAALRYMQSSPLTLVTLAPDVRSSFGEFEVLVYEGDNDQIAWDLQGVRHMGGLKVWGPYQQARFLVGLKQREDVSPSDLAQISGIGRTTVGRLLRSYYGFMQAVADADVGDQINQQDFSVFQEAIFHRSQSPISEWLGWSEETQRFENEERFKTLLALLKKTEDGGTPRIARVNPDLRDKFSKLLSRGHEAALEAFLSEEVGLDAALQRVVREDESAHVTDQFVDVDSQLASLSSLSERLSALPLPKIVNQGRAGDFVERLEDIHVTASQQLDALGFLAAAGSEIDRADSDG
jgi:hypothetical protein